MIPIFAKFATNAEKLAPPGSSQANEALNRVVMSKQPKALHYSSSESCDYRVAAAVCQMNLGTKYVSAVNEELNLSPGTKTLEYRTKLDTTRQKLKERSQCVDFKRHRKTSKKVRAMRRKNTENREGVTYLSDIGFDATQAPAARAESDPLPLPPSDSLTVVIFDLETTGFGNAAEIIQIAALHHEKEFSCYILPVKGFPSVVSQITKLQVVAGQLEYNGIVVRTTPPRLAILRFIDFLRTCGDNVVLVAHNGFRFDAAKLAQEIKRLNMWNEFISQVRGFNDTLPLFKKKLSDHDKNKLKNEQTNRVSFAQPLLVEKFLEPGDLEGAHNAVYDVKSLGKLITKFSLDDDIRKTLKHVDFKATEHASKTHKDATVKGFDQVKENISRHMINRMVEANITLDKVKEIYKQGQSSLHMLLGESVGGKPRVTNSKSVLQKITAAVSNLD